MRTVERDHMLPSWTSQLWWSGMTAREISDEIYRQTGHRFQVNTIYSKMRKLRRAGKNIGKRR